jgi:hypothetical protein
MTHRTYRALLVANSTYPSDPYNLPELEGPRNDLAVLRNAVCDADSGLFLTDNVRLAQERTMAEIMGEIEGFVLSASKRDTLLLYYSGHGRLDQYNELYWCARDTMTDRLRSSAVSASWVSGTLDQSAAGITVIVLDCCHAGAFKGGDSAGSIGGAGRFVLSSVRGTELAGDADKTNRASVFTAALAVSLRREVADGDSDGFVDLDDVYKYVRERMSREKKGIPHRRFDGTGDVAIARRSIPSEEPVPSPVPQPKLDVAPAALDFGDVSFAEELQPQRVWVINRGGGTLEWSAECREPWVRVEKDADGAMLHVRSPVGRHHTDVVFRATTGETKSVDVQVHRRRRRGVPLYVQLSILAIVAVIVGAVLLSRCGDGDDVREVTVPGSEQWTSTDMEIVAGDTITFRAEGVVIHNTATGDTAGPDGDDDPDVQQFNVIDGRHSALIGRLGPDGTPFIVGSELTWVATGSGVLELGVNDVDVTSNAGSFDVTLEREHLDGRPISSAIEH